ncbi:MAG: transcription antitermination factor NusB [Clostridia bacterium]|nr:transcription antitermination factor NusB [Clostridia bacterium]
MSNRSLARTAAMQLLFERLFGNDAELDALVEMSSEYNNNYVPSRADQAYIDEVVSGVNAHQMEIDDLISEYLRGWTLDRISKVDYAVLRLAVYELVYSGLPAPVVIDEAIELTRRFSQEESCRFVNGVLGNINRKLAKQ